MHAEAVNAAQRHATIPTDDGRVPQMLARRQVEGGGDRQAAASPVEVVPDLDRHVEARPEIDERRYRAVGGRHPHELDLDHRRRVLAIALVDELDRVLHDAIEVRRPAHGMIGRGRYGADAHRDPVDLMTQQELHHVAIEEMAVRDEVDEMIAVVPRDALDGVTKHRREERLAGAVKPKVPLRDL